MTLEWFQSRLVTESSGARFVALVVVLTLVAMSRPMVAQSTQEDPVFCSVLMSRPVYVNNNVVHVDNFAFGNRSSNPIAMEIKVWFTFPGSQPLSLINVGADGSVVLPPHTSVAPGRKSWSQGFTTLVYSILLGKQAPTTSSSSHRRWLTIPWPS